MRQYEHVPLHTKATRRQQAPRFGREGPALKISPVSLTCRHHGRHHGRHHRRHHGRHGCLRVRQWARRYHWRQRRSGQIAWPSQWTHSSCLTTYAAPVSIRASRASTSRPHAPTTGTAWGCMGAQHRSPACHTTPLHLGSSAGMYKHEHPEPFHDPPVATWGYQAAAGRREHCYKAICVLSFRVGVDIAKKSAKWSDPKQQLPGLGGTP